MKLVELLARELKEWPERTVEYVQGKDGCWPLSFSGARFEGSTWILKTGQTTGSGGDVLHIDMASDYKKARVTRAQWQAERDRQKGGEWKRHRGGRCPVQAGTKVSTRHRDGEVVDVHFQTAEYGTHKAVMDCVWKHDGSKNDIMSYKIISQPQAEKAEYRGAFPCAPAGEPATTIEYDIEFPSGAFNLEAKVDQIDGPLRWRDEVTELNAYIEKYTRERDALIERLASEGFALIPPVVSVVSEFSGVDMSDWRNWKAGDVLESMEQSMDIKLGGQYILSEDPFNEGDITFKDDAGDIRGRHADEYKFIRRP